VSRIKVEPNWSEINDEELTGLVAWCEKWKMERVYDTAFKEACMEGPSFSDWEAKNYPPLPLPVRTELRRAAMINYDRGRMNSLKLAHVSIQGLKFLLRQVTYAFFAFMLAYLILF